MNKERNGTCKNLRNGGQERFQSSSEFQNPQADPSLQLLETHRGSIPRFKSSTPNDTTTDNTRSRDPFEIHSIPQFNSISVDDTEEKSTTLLPRTVKCYLRLRKEGSPDPDKADCVPDDVSNHPKTYTMTNTNTGKDCGSFKNKDTHPETTTSHNFQKHKQSKEPISQQPLQLSVGGIIEESDRLLNSLQEDSRSRDSSRGNSDLAYIYMYPRTHQVPTRYLKGDPSCIEQTKLSGKRHPFVPHKDKAAQKYSLEEEHSTVNLSCKS